jgi:hypothetical protein
MPPPSAAAPGSACLICPPYPRRAFIASASEVVWGSLASLRNFHSSWSSCFATCSRNSGAAHLNTSKARSVLLCGREVQKRTSGSSVARRLFALIVSLHKCGQIRCPQLFPFLHARRRVKPLVFRYRHQLNGFIKASNHTHATADTLGPPHRRLAFHVLRDGRHGAAIIAHTARSALFRIYDLCSAITRSRRRGRRQMLVMKTTRHRSGAHP